MDPVVIEDYNPRWPAQFETLRSRLANLLSGLALTIEHVGSTAVPGLAAKSIIDMDVLLRSADDLPLAIAALSSIGTSTVAIWASQVAKLSEPRLAIPVIISTFAATTRNISVISPSEITCARTRKKQTPMPP